VLGFSPQQLHRPLPGESNSNQLAALTQSGVLAQPVVIRDDDPGRLVDPHDSALNLNDRARSYLHANCAMCHHPGGNAIVSFYLRRELPFDKLNTNKGTGIGTFGMPEARIIVPGDPYRSVLLYRMSKLGYARMPYIGSQVVDSAGVALIEQWIRSLPTAEGSGGTSAPATAGSAEAQFLRAMADRKSPQPERRDEALRALLKSTEGSLALVSLLHRGAVSAEDTRAAVALGSQSPSDIRGLFETFLPEPQRRKTLGANIDPASILNLVGDRQRGKLIFFSDGARCRNCHQIDDRGQSLGPTLQEINKKYPRPGELLQHVLQPSLKVEDPFAAYAITTDDGRLISGLLVEQSDQEVILKTAEKQTVRLARKSIDDMRKSEKSLMPERILSDLTAQEAADLFEYMRSPGSGE
jgi:putative heme-binding domain-containing protein